MDQKHFILVREADCENIMHVSMSAGAILPDAGVGNIWVEIFIEDGDSAEGYKITSLDPVAAVSVYDESRERRLQENAEREFIISKLIESAKDTYASEVDRIRQSVRDQCRRQFKEKVIACKGRRDLGRAVNDRRMRQKFLGGSTSESSGRSEGETV